MCDTLWRRHIIVLDGARDRVGNFGVRCRPAFMLQVFAHLVAVHVTNIRTVRTYGQYEYESWTTAVRGR
eukprot:5827376-Prymnesium_polylepis.2